MHEPIRVIIGDDHAVLRSGLRHLIDAEPDMIVVGEAGDGRATAALAQETQADVAIVDLSMPEGGGVAAMNAIRAAGLPTRVVVLTMHEGREYLGAAVQAGAAGYVQKRAAGTELLTAIRTVHGGRSYFLMPLDVPAEEVLAARPAEERPDLSRRERQVLVGVARGHTNREIADQLELSVKTVETYRARVRVKLGARSRAELVQHALRWDLVQPSATTPRGD